jgi:hypothetical protein
MSNMVVIGGVEVDIENPCDVLGELKKARLVIATGGSVSMTRFDQDEVRFTAANGGELQNLIGIYQRECDKANGRMAGRARRVRWTQ